MSITFGDGVIDVGTLPAGSKARFEGNKVIVSRPGQPDEILELRVVPAAFESFDFELVWTE